MTDIEKTDVASPGEPGAGPPARRESSLLARSPTFAVVMVLLSGWILWDFWPDVRYFFSPVQPIDLGGPGEYHLDRAATDRLVQVRGELREAVPVVQSKAVRMVGRLEGTNLLVDRPGRDGPPLYEGRLLSARAARKAYAQVVAEMRSRGTELGEAWLVLRDGERPRSNHIPLLGSLLSLFVFSVNLRALVKGLLR